MKNNIADIVCNSMAVVFTAVQTEYIFQIISLILTCISIAIGIIIRLISWYKNAKRDDKIDADEIKEGAEITKSGIDEIKDTVDKNNK